MQHVIHPLLLEGSISEVTVTSITRLLLYLQMLQGKLHDASKKSPREWWALLKDLRSNAKWEDSDQYASIDDLTNFFQRLYNTPTEDPSDQQTPAFSSKNYFELHGPSQAQEDLLIEAPISPMEISMGIKNLSSGKTTSPMKCYK